MIFKVPSNISYSIIPSKALLSKKMHFWNCLFNHAVRSGNAKEGCLQVPASMGGTVGGGMVMI